MSAACPLLLSSDCLRCDGRRPLELRGLRLSTCSIPLPFIAPAGAAAPICEGKNEEASAAGYSLKKAGTAASSSSALGRRDRGAADSTSLFSPASAHADGRGIVCVGSTRVACFVYGPQPLKMKTAGRAAGHHSGGGWSEGFAAARGGAAAAVDENFFSEAWDAADERAAVEAGEAKTCLLSCRAIVAPFGTDAGASAFAERNRTAAAAAFGAAQPVSTGGFGEGTAVLHGGASASVSSAGSAQEQELAFAVRKVVEGVVLGEAHPRSVVSLFIHVIEDDGGILAASVCAASLALIDAGIALRDFVAAVSCVCLPRPQTPLLDPSRAELQSNSSILTVALLPATEEVVLMQLNGKVSTDLFEEMYEVCVKGCRELAEVMRATVTEAAVRRLRFADRMLR